MSFKRGQIVTYSFPERETDVIDKTKVINGYHRAVVLHQRETPYDTILIAAITKAEALKSKGKIPSNYVKLLKENYPFVLEEDSYINLDMIMVVDNIEIRSLERFGKFIVAVLNKGDCKDLDYKMILTYELNKYIKTIVDEEINREFESVISYIDQDIRERIEHVLRKINNVEIIKEITEIIDMLINDLKENYSKKTWGE